MAQSNTLSHLRIVQVGEETTFGTAPAGAWPNAFDDLICLPDDLIFDGIATEMLENLDERTRRLDALDRIPGLKIGSKFALSAQLKAVPSASFLTAAGTAGSLSHRLLLRHHFGAERSALGSLVVAAPAPSTVGFSVTATQGSRFTKGTWIAVEQQTNSFEVAKVTDVSTDAITIAPALSNAPATGAIVRNLYNYAPANSHTGSGTGANTGGSLAIRGSFPGDTNFDYTLVGCYGSLAFDLGEYGKVPRLKLSGAVTSYTGPSNALSLSTPTDDMGAPVIWKPQVLFAAAPSRATRYVVEKLAITHENTWEQVRDGGATQTVVDVVNTAGRPFAVKGTMTVRCDQAEAASFFNTRTSRQLIVINTYGSGATQAFQVWEVPIAFLVAEPKITRVGSRLHMDLEFEGLQDTAITTPGTPSGDEDFHRAPFRFAMG